VLEKATSAKNSAKFERLWNGSTGGYDSHSEADMALCFHLAFWTGGDTAQIDRLFRRSGLMRAKWDEVHFADGSTYGEKTVERAVQRADEFYDPPETGDQKESPAEDSAVTPRKQPNSVPRPQAPPSHGSGASPTLTGADHRLFDLVDRLEARVEQLEAENEALRAQLADARREKDPFEQETGSEETTQSTGTRSVWDRIVSRIGSSNE
jgi:hypothetical protein